MVSKSLNLSGSISKADRGVEMIYDPVYQERTKKMPLFLVMFSSKEDKERGVNILGFLSFL